MSAGIPIMHKSDSGSLLTYYKPFTYTEAYNLPVALREYYYDKMQKDTKELVKVD